MPDPGSDLDLKREQGLDFVVQAAREALAQEFARAERLDAKARGQMTMAAAWFGTVQVVAGIVLKDQASSPVWLIAVAALAFCSGAALLGAFLSLGSVWRLEPQPALSQETLEDMADASGKPRFREQTVLLYRNLLGHAQNQNDARGNALDGAGAWLVATHVLALTELFVALLATILHGV